MTQFTGFWELHGPGIEDEVATTITQIETDELLERLRVRLRDVPAGSHVRIDLVAWSDE